MERIVTAAEKLIVILKNKGFVVHRYDSYTTNSIYLKLDYGVGNSIRISDHKGKKHLKYRFNLEIGRKNINRHKIEKGMYRFYYPIEKIGVLIDDVQKEKKIKIDKYGKNNYKRYMEMNKKDNFNKKGFWSKCWEV